MGVADSSLGENVEDDINILMALSKENARPLVGGGGGGGGVGGRQHTPNSSKTTDQTPSPISTLKRASSLSVLTKEFESKREEQINKLLATQPVDLDALYAISRLEGGFLNSRLRTRVWPKFLGVNRYDGEMDYRLLVDQSKLDPQVKCDVDRSLYNFHMTKQWEPDYLEKKRQTLSNIITAILIKNPSKYYYQGFHDVVSVFLLVLDEDQLAFKCAEVVRQVQIVM